MRSLIIGLFVISSLGVFAHNGTDGPKKDVKLDQQPSLKPTVKVHVFNIFDLGIKNKPEIQKADSTATAPDLYNFFKQKMNLIHQQNSWKDLF